MTAAKSKRNDGPFQLLIVVRYCRMLNPLNADAVVSVGIHSTIASFDTKVKADIAFANIAELVNASGEYAVTKLYI